MYGNALEIELHVKKQESQLTEALATISELSALIDAVIAPSPHGVIEDAIDALAAYRERSK